MTTKKPLFIIDEQQPGSILKDFATLLAFIEEGKYPVSKKLLHFPPKAIIELNQRMMHPTLHNFARPAQRSFHHINVLYICARELDLFCYENKSSKKKIFLDSKNLEVWNGLNNTEKYFSLFDICFSSQDIIYLSVLDWFERIHKKYLSKGKLRHGDALHKSLVSSYKIQPVLAVLELLGICEIEQIKNSPDNGWSIQSVEQTELGRIIAPYLSQLREQVLESDYMIEGTIFGLSYKTFQSYFSDLKHTFTPCVEQYVNKGDYVFKVSLGTMWRRISLNHSNTLYDLADGILHFINFENDHLHSFSFIDLKGRKIEYSHPMAMHGEEDGATDEITLEALSLGIKNTMTFIFDFGDWWEFKVLLEKVVTPSVIDDKYIELLDSRGEDPEQYPDWDED